MPRQARFSGEYQHIIVRGNGKQIIFEDDMDRRYYLTLLRRYSQETGIVMLAYCLMENHVHFLIKDAAGNTPLFMKKLGVSYVYYYNHKYERVGHLFQDRYKSETVADDTYLLTVYRYILRNPQKAGIARAADYPWSSYGDYASGTGMTDPSLLRELIGSKEAFTDFMSAEDDTECMEADTLRRDDTWALSIIRRTLQLQSGTELQNMPRQKRDECIAKLRSAGLSVRQIERLTGINRGVIQKM